MNQRLLLELTPADADILRDALEHTHGVEAKQEDITALREEIETLAPHPGVVIDMRPSNGPRIYAGRSLPIPIIVVRAVDESPRVEPLEINTAWVASVSDAVRVGNEYAGARQLLRTALLHLENATTGLNADRNQAQLILKKLHKDLRDWQ